MAQWACVLEVVRTASVFLTPWWLCAQVGQQKKEKHTSLWDSATVSSGGACSHHYEQGMSLHTFPSVCNPPPQQGLPWGHGQQSQTLQRHTASPCRRSVLRPSEAEVPQKQLHLMSWPDSRRSPCVIPGILWAANLPQVRGSALKLFSHQLFRCFSENPPNRPSPVKPTWKIKTKKSMLCSLRFLCGK